MKEGSLVGGDRKDDDLELVGRARGGDRGAMARLVHRHQDEVFYLALGLLGNRHDAEDAMQEVFIKAMKALDRFDGRSSLGTWLYRITVNACRDQQRRRRWKWFSLDQSSEVQLEEPSPSDPQRTEAQRQAQADLCKALDRLTTRERQVFALRQFRELSVRETAAVLGLAEGSVKALLFRALGKLRDELGQHAPEEVTA